MVCVRNAAGVAPWRNCPETFTLLSSVPGFARRTLAETLQYSYSAQNAVTYRIPLLGIASDGGQ